MDFLTTTEIAAMFRVKKHTVAAWIRTGVLPAWRVGRQYRIERAAVERFVVPPGERR